MNESWPFVLMGCWVHPLTCAPFVPHTYDHVDIHAYEPVFSIRVRKALIKDWYGKSYQTIGELLQATAKDIYERKNFGAGCLAEVRAKLAANGLRLKGE